MTSKTILPLLATAATLVAASAAVAADKSTPPATAAGIELRGAYAYLENLPHAKQPYVTVVYRTTGALQRRFDGMVKAAGSLDGLAASTGGFPGTKGSAANHCYAISVRTKDGRIYGGGRINVGSRHTFEVSARDADGNVIGDSARVTIKRRKAGDRSGKPLGC